MDLLETSELGGSEGAISKETLRQRDPCTRASKIGSARKPHMRKQSHPTSAGQQQKPSVASVDDYTLGAYMR